MKENLYMLKKWWDFAKPSKKYFFISLLSSCLYRICIVIEPIFSAKVITSLTVNNYKMAIIYLLCGVLLYALRNVLLHPKYMTHPKLYESTFTRLQSEIVKKIFVADNENFKINSANKLMNIFHADVYTVANFGDTLTGKLGRLLQVLITLGIVCFINPWVSLVILLMIIVNSLLISILQTYYAKGTKRIREAVDSEFAEFSKVLEAKDYIQSEKLKEQMLKNVKKNSENYVKEFAKRQHWASAIDNWYYVWCNIFICVVTIFLVVLVSKNSMNLENYLIVVPYISSCINMSNEFLTVFTDLKNTIVSVNRVNTVCEFTERDAVRFGKNNYDDVLGTIDFIDLFYAKKTDDEVRTSLKDINFHVKEGDSVLITGARKSGKRTIFEILTRTADPDKGHVYIDGLEIGEYSKKAYNKNVTYCTSKPYFFYDTILKEMKIVSANRKKIKKALEDVGIYNEIMSFKEKLDLSPNVLSNKSKFLLGLARCLLSNSGVVLIYEIPTNISESDKAEIYNVLTRLQGTRTIIIFSANTIVAEVCNKVVEIEGGQIKNITFNDSNTKKELYNV